MTPLTPAQEAWNRLIDNGFSPAAQAAPDPFGAAAIAACFSCETGSGGLIGWLTVFPEIATADACAALHTIGAKAAARELRTMVEWLGGDLPAATREERDAIIDRAERDDEPDETLSQQAEQELTIALQAHVEAHLAHYLALPAPSGLSISPPDAD